MGDGRCAVQGLGGSRHDILYHKKKVLSIVESDGFYRKLGKDGFWKKRDDVHESKRRQTKAEWQIFNTNYNVPHMKRGFSGYAGAKTPTLLEKVSELFQFRDGHNQPLPSQHSQIILNTIRRILEACPHFANRDTKFAGRKVQLVR